MYNGEKNEYDRKIQIGKTTVYIVEPKISDEVRQKRIKSLEATIGSLFDCKCTIRLKE